MAVEKNKDHNIEKLDFETIEREEIPYVLVSTFVIQNITNHFAGFVWVYLQSLPPKWEINKAHIMKYFGISERTYQRHMSFLASSNLVRYERNRLENGTLGPVKLKVLNGTDFILDAGSGHAAKIGVVDFNHTAKKPHSGGTTAVGFGRHINTINNTNKTEKKESLDLPPISPKWDGGRFQDFWEAYPEKKARKVCEQIWKRRKLDLIADEIIEAIHLLAQNDDKWLRGYVPNPSTFLNQDRWNDEITESQAKKHERDVAAKKALRENQLAEQEALSQRLADEARARQNQYNKDGAAARALQRKVRRETPKGYLALRASLGLSHE